jgi:hypothetical protein
MPAKGPEADGLEHRGQMANAVADVERERSGRRSAIVEIAAKAAKVAAEQPRCCVEAAGGSGTQQRECAATTLSVGRSS